MAYFANGCEGDYYEAKYCARCANFRDRGDGESCPVLSLHFAWNYDAVGKGADETKRAALETLWPCDGVHNGECQMFLERT